MIGATIIDTYLDRRGTIESYNLETLAIAVSWRPGQITDLKPADIAAGRYQVETPCQP